MFTIFMILILLSCVISVLEVAHSRFLCQSIVIMLTFVDGNTSHWWSRGQILSQRLCQKKNTKAELSHVFKMGSLVFISQRSANRFWWNKQVSYAIWREEFDSDIRMYKTSRSKTIFLKNRKSDIFFGGTVFGFFPLLTCWPRIWPTRKKGRVEYERG
jgi:hypothetical protein